VALWFATAHFSSCKKHTPKRARGTAARNQNRPAAVPKRRRENNECQGNEGMVVRVTRSCFWKIHLSRCVEVRKSDIFALLLLPHSIARDALHLERKPVYGMETTAVAPVWARRAAAAAVARRAAAVARSAAASAGGGGGRRKGQQPCVVVDSACFSLRGASRPSPTLYGLSDEGRW
jgi:hypothetical protein